MTVFLSRVAWRGIALHTEDPTLKTRVAGLLLLSRSDRPACDLPRQLVEAAMRAYQAWAVRTRLAGVRR